MITLARRKLAAAVAAAAVAGSAIAATELSGTTSVFVNPSATPLWTTVTGGAITVPVSYPDGAQSATLTVTAFGYSKTYEKVAEGDFEFELPATDGADGERVYTLTLAFDNGASESAMLGCIAGDGESLAKVILDEEFAKWSEIHRTALVPMAEGASALLDGDTECDSTPYAGWAFVGRHSPGDKVTLTTTADGEEVSVELMCVSSTGLYIILR